ncbi:serine/threonine-protein kinase [Streptomyces sp. NBC_00059]|uniref:serine/threonine-protein kinase n=1 Tax=Streptomyces sp. NBC_00059 TaxID=2975635 RepID=UPI002253DB80|nr:serine/threonine-protein kinase [Streptomyces sp. NBC_00059]MCX5417870.1 serine/threonine protein kinase [Streptomyces sp. NBC_00059]
MHPIAAGGFGRVWKAHDEVLRADVVVKEVVLPAAADPDEQARRLRYAEREARNAARLRHHPGIVPVYDVVTEDGRPWIVMELIDGSSLEELLNSDGPFSRTRTAEIADTLLKALDAAHCAEVVHRDIKPANIMLAADGRILLTDFGIATHEVDTRLTTDGAVIGSLEYMAPERLNGVSGTPASDLFSLGVTLYRIVEGVSPFLRNTPTATLAAVVMEDPPPLRRAGKLTALIEALLAKDPHARPTLAEARVLLRASHASKTSGNSTGRTAKGGKKRRPDESGTASDPRAAEVFEQSWTGDEDPPSFSEYRSIGDQVLGYGFGILIFWGAMLSDWNDNIVGSWTAAAVGLLLLGFPSFRQWQDRRSLRGAMSPRTLRIHEGGITTSDPFGTQHIPWTEIEHISVHHTETTISHHRLLALHLRLSAPQPGSPPPVLYRAVGQHTEPDATGRHQGDWVPVCVLGPMNGPLRVDLRNVVAAFTKRPLRMEHNS